MNFHYIFCNICKGICDIEHDYEEGIEKYICEEHGEVEGIESESCLCIGCENFDPDIPLFDKINGYCDIYPKMPFKMFKRKSKCKHFEVSSDL